MFEDTMNVHLVSTGGDDRIFIVRPPSAPLTREQALLFAAWIVTLADPMGEDFPLALKAVQST